MVFQVTTRFLPESIQFVRLMFQMHRNHSIPFINKSVTAWVQANDKCDDFQRSQYIFQSISRYIVLKSRSYSFTSVAFFMNTSHSVCIVGEIKCIGRGIVCSCGKNRWLFTICHSTYSILLKNTSLVLI